MSSDLHVYVVNSRVGESIVLRYDGGRFGIIDLFDETGLRLLRRIVPANAPIDFLCLTHPHWDHFNGMAALIDGAPGRIRHFWRYPGLSTREALARYLSKPHCQRHPRVDEMVKYATEEFIRLTGAIAAHARSWNQTSWRLSDPHLVELFSEGGLRLFAMAPPDHVIAAFEDFLKDPGLPFYEQARNGENLVSCIFVVEFASRYLLFLADVVHEDVFANALSELKRLGIAPESVVYAKCSHHGSETGWHDAFLTYLKPLEHLTITAFPPSHLPRAEMVARYRGLAKSVTLVSGQFRPRDDKPAIYERLGTNNHNCDHIVVNADGHLEHEHMTI